MGLLSGPLAPASGERVRVRGFAFRSARPLTPTLSPEDGGEGAGMRRHAVTPRLTVHARAVAGVAAADFQVFFELLAAHRIARLAVLFQQFRHEARVGAAVLPHPAAVSVGKRDVAVAEAVEEQFFRRVGQFLPRRFQHGAVGERQILFDGLRDAVVDVPPPAADACQLADQRDRPLRDGQRRIGDDAVQHEIVPHAQAVAVGTHPLRTVEAEELRRRRLVADPAVDAGVVAGEQLVEG